MFKKPALTVAILIVHLSWLALAGASKRDQSEAPRFTRYAEMRQRFGELYEQKKFKEAAALIEAHLGLFPENLRANAFNLALTYLRLDEMEKAVDRLNYALDRGVWFGKYTFYDDAWAPLKERPAFKTFSERNEGMIREAQKDVRPALEVLKPEGFVEGKRYPLFIALHGGGGNIAEFKQVWTSPKLRTGYITAYPQSVQLVSENGYSWTEDVAQARRDVKSYYERIIREHPVDTSQVVIGGFSSGGAASLEAVFGDLFPVIGFIVLCPPRVESVDEAAARSAARRGVRGVLITTEFDPRLKEQRDMVEVMKKAGLALEVFVFPNTGHWIPTDLDKKVDVGLDYIRQGRSGT